jgi:hypothetical protein
MKRYAEAKNEQDKDNESEACSERQRPELETQLPMEEIMASLREGL